jgi:hypothetical protein
LLSLSVPHPCPNVGKGVEIAPTIEQLEAMSDEEVRAVYNETSVNTVVGLEWFREELHWRATDRRNRNIERMTFAILALTLANLAFIVVTLFE